nr:hypothetical protein [Tanacetum cinerariifolium]
MWDLQLGTFGDTYHLALPDFSKTFTIETDASGYRVRAVLMQEGKPIAYFSQVLGPRAQLKSVYERDLIAIVMAVQKWRPYLLRHKFKVITDQKSLKFLLEQRVVVGEYQRWVSKLSGYDFEIVYRPGSENGVDDALSRRGGDYELSELTVARINSDTSLLQAVRGDSEIVELRTRLLNDGDGLEGYGIVDGDVRYKGRMNKYSNLAPARLLQPLNLPKRIWEELSMDLLMGCPSQRDTALSWLWSIGLELFKYQGTQLKRSTAYHPQTDGQTEVVNHSLETYLRCFSSSKPKQWVKWLLWAEYWYNISFHSSIGMTPFKVLYERDPPTIIVEKVGVVAYRLKLTPTAAIHPVFHVSQLKAVIGDHVAEPELPMGLTEDMDVVCKPVEGASNDTNQGRFKKVYQRRKEAT